ncbi:MAG: hypothetical protein AAF621_01920 [Pseudomonadota bacterium]
MFQFLCKVLIKAIFILPAIASAAEPEKLYLGEGSITELAFEQFNGTDKHITLNGVAKLTIDEFSQSEEERTILRLTPRLPNSDGHIAGSAYAKYPLKGFRIGYPFSTFFRYRVTASNVYDGSGMVFAIHSDKREDKALGKCKFCMGFSGNALIGRSVKPSVGIEFDIYLNAKDYDYNMVGLNFHGSKVSRYIHTGAFLPNSRTETIESPYTERPINNGIPWNVWIDFDGTVIEVRSSQQNYRADATLHLRREVNMRDAMSLRKQKGEEIEPIVFVGFSADPGLYPAYTDILQWYFRPCHAPYGDYVGDIVDQKEREAKKGEDVICFKEGLGRGTIDRNIEDISPPTGGGVE